MRWQRCGLRLCTAVLWLWCAVGSSQAILFDDQKGANNWLSQHVGRVSHASILRSTPAVVVASEQGVLASLNLRDGRIVWRKNLLDEGIAHLFLSDKADLAYTVDREGTTLRAWAVSSAHLAWETALRTPGQGSSAAVVAHFAGGAESEDDYVAVLAARSLTAYAATSGRVLWAKPKLVRQSSPTVVRRVGPALWVVATQSDSSELDVIHLDAATGDVVLSTALTAPAAPSQHIVATDDAVLFLAASGDQLCEISIRPTPDPEQAPALSCQRLPAGSVQNARLEAGSHSAVLQSDTGVWTIHTASSRAAVQRVDGPAGVVSPVTSDGEHEAVAIARAQEGTEVAVEVVDATDARLVTSEAVRVAEDVKEASAQVARVWLLPYTRSSGKTEFVSLLRAADDTLMLTRQGRVLWKREEALAAVRKVLVSDLPSPGSSFAPRAKRPLSLAEHLTLNLLILKSTLRLCSDEELRQIAQLRVQASQRHVGTRDVLGTRRLLLAVTESGKLFGLHSSDGRVLWSTLAPSGGLPIVDVRSFRMNHDPNTQPQAVLIFSDAVRATAVTVGVYTGDVAHVEALDAPVGQVAALPERLHEGGGAQQSVLLLAPPTLADGDSAQLRLLPDSPAARALARAAAPTTFLWAAKKAEGQAAGFQVSGDVPEAGPLTARLTWRLTFPAPLVAVAPHEAPRALIHHVKVLGDRSMRFRYLNPNSALLVTGTPDGDALEASAAAPVLTAYVVDTVTGRVLHQQEHSNARGPVAAVMYDNIAVLQFWDRPAFRWQVTVMELFDRSKPMPTAATLIGAIGSRSAANRVSSFTPVTLEVQRQSFFSKAAIRAMAVTSTAHSVTPRHLLLATAGDQLFDLDAILLDVRRPMTQKLTAEQREERLIPYTPQLPFVPTSYASYDAQVFGVANVVTAPAELESTTHAFAWGVDTYYAMLRPARGFDMLDEDFSFALLTVALLGLLLGTLALHHVTKRQRVKAQWH